MSTLLSGAVDFGLKSPVNMCDLVHYGGPSLLFPITRKREKAGLFDGRARNGLGIGSSEKMLQSRQHDLYLGIAEWERTLAVASELSIASRLFRASAPRTGDSA